MGEASPAESASRTQRPCNTPQRSGRTCTITPSCLACANRVFIISRLGSGAAARPPHPEADRGPGRAATARSARIITPQDDDHPTAAAAGTQAPRAGRPRSNSAAIAGPGTDDRSGGRAGRAIRSRGHGVGRRSALLRPGELPRRRIGPGWIRRPGRPRTWRSADRAPSPPDHFTSGRARPRGRPRPPHARRGPLPYAPRRRPARCPGRPACRPSPPP